jgi:hypothetical protein
VWCTWRCARAPPPHLALGSAGAALVHAEAQLVGIVKFGVVDIGKEPELAQQ